MCVIFELGAIAPVPPVKVVPKLNMKKSVKSKVTFNDDEKSP